MYEYIFSGMATTDTEKGPLTVPKMNYITVALCDTVRRSYKLSKRDRLHFGSLDLIELFFYYWKQETKSFTLCGLFFVQYFRCGLYWPAGIESITWTHRADSVTTLDEIRIKTLICRGDIWLNMGSELWDERLSGGLVFCAFLTFYLW